MEKAPDKIYVPIVNLGIEEGEHPAPLWWNKDKKSEHSDVVGTIAYIRKDALLEWANERKKNISEKQQKYPQDNDWYDGESFILDELIDKINSL